MRDCMNPYDIIQYPLMTEKVMKGVEEENKVSFVVNRKATKGDIKAALKELYGVDILKINTLITLHGKKKAVVRLKEEGSAESLATKLGML